MSAALNVVDLSYTHPGSGAAAVANVNLEVASGESVALLGSSGAGKTTLLTLLDGRLRGWLGQAELLGRALSPDHPPPREARADVGFIFQDFALVDRATVVQNTLNGRLGRTNPWAAFAGHFSAADRRAVAQAMHDAGIADLADRRVDSLSGGQRQRVAIARCLAQEPLLMLADEPVSNLDPARAEAILGLIAEAARARGTTVVFSSHQPDLAKRFASRVVGMRDGAIMFDRQVEDVEPGETADLYRAEADKSERVAGIRLVQ